MWEQTFDAIRERIGIKCEQCDISLSQEKYYLEVHYKDYNKNDLETKVHTFNSQIP